jgi:hypothetical protein
MVKTTIVVMLGSIPSRPLSGTTTKSFHPILTNSPDREWGLVDSAAQFV